MTESGCFPFGFFFMILISSIRVMCSWSFAGQQAGKEIMALLTLVDTSPLTLQLQQWQCKTGYILSTTCVPTCTAPHHSPWPWPPFLATAQFTVTQQFATLIWYVTYLIILCWYEVCSAVSHGSCCCCCNPSNKYVMAKGLFVHQDLHLHLSLISYYTNPDSSPWSHVPLHHMTPLDPPWSSITEHDWVWPLVLVMTQRGKWLLFYFLWLIATYNRLLD